LEGRLEEPLFCKNISCIKNSLVRNSCERERAQERRGEKVLKTLLQSSLCKSLYKTIQINTKAVFPAYEVFVFLCVVNVYSLNVFCVYLCMLLDACMFPLQELDRILYLCEFLSSSGLLGLCKECTPELEKTL
jgi:hypothetical protein